MSPYDTDLAYVHDVGFGWFAKQASSGVLDILEKNGITGGLVVDLGCGSGIWARDLVDAGYEVMGVDISPAMIEIARKRVPDADFRVESFLKTTFPPCQSVTSLGEVFNYLFDKRNGTRSLRQLFTRVFNSLDSSGVFVFDVAKPGRQKRCRQGFKAGDGWVTLSEVKHDEHNHRLTRHCMTFRKVGQLYRRHEETHHLQLYRSSKISNLLREAGFRVRCVRAYGDYPLPESLVGFVARKL